MFYDVGGTPNAWFDGVLECGGAITNDAQMYGWYHDQYLARMAVPTDVIISLSARETDTAQTYDVTAEVCLEAGGTGKYVRVHLVEVLDHWPTYPIYERNTLRQHAGEEDFHINPGQCRTVKRTFTFDATSWANQSDIKIIAWAQDQLDSAPSEIYQSAVMPWPFVPGKLTMDYVDVGNPGNTPDDEVMDDMTTGYGTVAYQYRIGKYEITAGQYTEFLNAVAATDTYNLYNEYMDRDLHPSYRGCNIQRSGSPGSYSYSVSSDWADRPVNFASWGDAARFANWLHNGQPTGAQDLTTTEDGAYYLNGATTNAALLAVTRKPGALVFLPSEDEWYKAAYYKGGGTTAGYWDYPTQSDTVPMAEAPPGADMVNGSANYYDGAYVDPTYFTTEVGAYDAKPSDSAYGTFDQGGNVWEWNEAILYEDYRGLRAGSFRICSESDCGYHLHAGTRNYHYPEVGDDYYGFRVASLVDCNGNGIPDICDISCGETGGMCDAPGCGLGADCNFNGILDECDLDTCEEGDLFCADCNDNQALDGCELVDNDCDSNSIPDDCQPDCDVDGTPDICEIPPIGSSPDCNSNGLPDECDMTGGGLLLETDFEAGLPGDWGISGDLQITDRCGVSDPDCGGSLWAYAGNTATCTYGDNLFGEIVLPAVTLGNGESEVRFCSFLETEADYDFGRVRVDGILVWEESGVSGGWVQEVVDLDAFARQTVNITFEFYSDAGVSGDRGWLLDNIQVISGSFDCQPNSIPDECETDCNENTVPDDCDLTAGTSPDSDGNSEPDECDIAAGPSSPDTWTRNRYVAFSPDSGAVEVAFEVGLTGVGPAECYENDPSGAVGSAWWVGDPYEVAPGLYFARLTTVNPGYRVWDEAVVYVGDCEVIPVASYAIRAAVPTVPGPSYSDPLGTGTIAQPVPAKWADCIGAMSEGAWTEPNEVVNFMDVNAAVQYFTGEPTAPHLVSVDLEPEVPNAVLNFADIQQIVYAFQGAPYPFGSPADCP